MRVSAQLGLMLVNTNFYTPSVTSIGGATFLSAKEENPVCSNCGGTMLLVCSLNHDSFPLRGSMRSRGVSRLFICASPGCTLFNEGGTIETEVLQSCEPLYWAQDGCSLHLAERSVCAQRVVMRGDSDAKRSGMLVTREEERTLIELHLEQVGVELIYVDSNGPAFIKRIVLEDTVDGLRMKKVKTARGKFKTLPAPSAMAELPPIEEALPIKKENKAKREARSPSPSSREASPAPVKKEPVRSCLKKTSPAPKQAPLSDDEEEAAVIVNQPVLHTILPHPEGLFSTPTPRKAPVSARVGPDYKAPVWPARNRPLTNEKTLPPHRDANKAGIPVTSKEVGKPGEMNKAIAQKEENKVTESKKENKVTESKKDNKVTNKKQTTEPRKGATKKQGTLKKCTPSDTVPVGEWNTVVNKSTVKKEKSATRKKEKAAAR